MSLSNLGLNEANVTALLCLGAGLIAVLLAILTALFVLGSVAFYEMAKGQEIRRKWYGFVPFFKSVMRGNLAQGIDSSAFGKISLAFAVLVLFLGLGTAGTFLSAATKIVFAADAAVAAGKDSIAAEIITCLAPVKFFLYIFALTLFVKHIFDSFCNYCIYKRNGVRAAAVYTVLGFLLPFLTPVFMFCVRPKIAYIDEE